MKNKKALLYVLGFLVVCIWGMIIMKVYAAVGDEEEPAVALRGVGNVAKTRVPVLQPDTFQLQLNYGDPFKEVAAEEVVPKTAPLTSFNQVPLARPIAAQPMINPLANTKYLGYVWNAGNRKKVAIINQNGKEMMIEEGHQLEELQLLSITTDSVKVKFKGKTSFIRINK
uniref:hypothetical protein n=1 Tax=Pedobacter schmidteae TaxID=2201271 RepID=UPI000EB16A13|nr:hypothetical protein [Pedobacter schmidteae]